MLHPHLQLEDHQQQQFKFKPKPLLNAIAGLVLGALLGILIVFALEWLEADILRTPAAVERSLGLTVLGSIPAEASQPARSARRGQKVIPAPAAPVQP